MLRRTLTLLGTVVLAGVVATLVYFNPQPTSLRWAPERTVTLPLGVLALAAAAGATVLTFLAMLLREGRRSLRQWRVHRQLRTAEQTAECRAEARSLMLAGEPARARILFAKAAKRHEPALADVIDYAETYSMTGEHLQARRVLEDGQKDFGNDPLLLFALAQTNRALGDTASAVSALERARSVYPDSPQILRLLRDLLCEQKDWQRCVDLQQRIAALAAEDTREHNRLLGLRFEAAMAADPEQRDKQMSSLLKSEPGFVPALLERARLLEAGGKQRQAVRLLEKAVRRRPRAVLLGKLEELLSGEQAGRMAKLYGKLITAHPGQGRLRLHAARYLLCAGRSEEAAALLEAANIDGDQASLDSLWGRIYEARSDREKAHAAYQRACAASQSSAACFRCELCAALSQRWQRRCPACGGWGMLESL